MTLQLTLVIPSTGCCCHDNYLHWDLRARLCSNGSSAGSCAAHVCRMQLLPHIRHIMLHRRVTGPRCSYHLSLTRHNLSHRPFVWVCGGPLHCDLHLVCLRRPPLARVWTLFRNVLPSDPEDSASTASRQPGAKRHS
ncbi:hypothetical protein DPEC_G00303370 [Dallia pectoralis]|uniref:Uncharacterized protein n=1 Tax=Dallia pectoralis TaxID=75939 RepID=A0ACC2FDH8_DALPE|nr:hypothetical protein DPEC_G00303370 [Dallia pectoralis]